MKKILVAIFLSLFLFSSVALSADIPLEWRESFGASGYKFQTSQDYGATWIDIPNFTYTTFILVDQATQEIRKMARATVTVADNVLVLARIAAYNNIGTTWRLESGTWFNNAWQPLPAPTGLGTQ